MNKKIIFMGTPDFACTILERLLYGNDNVVAVVSQPDKKVGRKQQLQPTPVKELAVAHQIPVLQPVSIRHDYQDILSYHPDIIITCAYGQMIPQEVLEAPVYGSINVHASLLPKLRGGAPIHKAIINGDHKSGVSIMRMVDKMDAGAVMAQCEVPILETDTTGDLYARLKTAGAELLMESLPSIFDGTAVFVEQDEKEATFAYNISKEEEKIGFHRPVRDVYNHIRGLIPAPIGYGVIQGKKIKFHQVRMISQLHSYLPGECIGMLEGGFAIACKDGFLIADKLQMEGKSAMDAKSFYNGAGKQLVGNCFM